eukprot:GDKK01064678.1.p1 GENE.GDKK01064678.1~~GDKK01064678.1.p1  ORF type:complete len:443 (+),score=141.64 GDKK01064678.1:34-1362(+)
MKMNLATALLGVAAATTDSQPLSLRASREMQFKNYLESRNITVPESDFEYRLSVFFNNIARYPDTNLEDLQDMHLKDHELNVVVSGFHIPLDHKIPFAMMTSAEADELAVGNKNNLRFDEDTRPPPEIDIDTRRAMEKMVFFPLDRKNATRGVSKFHPYGVDLRGCFSSIRDQGHCASAWAFAAADVVKGAYCHKFTKYYFDSSDLSVQQLIDCWNEPDIATRDAGIMQKIGGGGCNGGDILNAAAFAIEHPLALERDYPYVMQNQKNGKNMCNRDTLEKVIPFFRADNLIGILGGLAQYLVEAIDQYGTISVAVYASTMARFKGKVVIDAKNCPAPTLEEYNNELVSEGQSRPMTPEESAFYKDALALNHAVTLVGYEMDLAKKEPIFLLRNSWGSRAGDEGYFRVKFGGCGLGNTYSAAIVPPEDEPRQPKFDDEAALRI